VYSGEIGQTVVFSTLLHNSINKVEIKGKAAPVLN
jgi:hypothetical protein